MSSGQREKALLIVEVELEVGAVVLWPESGRGLICVLRPFLREPLGPPAWGTVLTDVW